MAQCSICYGDKNVVYEVRTTFGLRVAICKTCAYLPTLYDPNTKIEVYNQDTRSKLFLESNGYTVRESYSLETFNEFRYYAERTLRIMDPLATIWYECEVLHINFKHQRVTIISAATDQPTTIRLQIEKLMEYVYQATMGQISNQEEVDYYVETI